MLMSQGNVARIRAGGRSQQWLAGQLLVGVVLVVSLVVGRCSGQQQQAAGTAQAQAQQGPEPGAGTKECGGCGGSVVAAVIVTLLVCLVLHALSHCFYYKKKIAEAKKDRLIPVTLRDTEEGAFDNPAFVPETPAPVPVEVGIKDGVEVRGTSSVAVGTSPPPRASSSSLSKENDRMSTLEKLVKAVRPSGSKSPRKSQDDSMIQVEPTIVAVPLRGHDFTGLGFNICGNLRDGVFIKDVSSRGPAMESGKVSAGDRLLGLAVSMEHMVHEDALTLISYASAYPVYLLLEHGIQGSKSRLPSDGVGRPLHPFYRSRSIDDLNKVSKADRLRAKESQSKNDRKSPSNYDQDINSSAMMAGKLENFSSQIDYPRVDIGLVTRDVPGRHSERAIDVPGAENPPPKSQISVDTKNTSKSHSKFGVKVLPDLMMKTPKIDVDIEAVDTSKATNISPVLPSARLNVESEILEVENDRKNKTASKLLNFEAKVTDVITKSGQASKNKESDNSINQTANSNLQLRDNVDGKFSAEYSVKDIEIVNNANIEIDQKIQDFSENLSLTKGSAENFEKSESNYSDEVKFDIKDISSETFDQNKLNITAILPKVDSETGENTAVHSSEININSNNFILPKDSMLNKVETIDAESSIITSASHNFEIHPTEIKGSIPELSLSNKNSAFLTGTQLDVNASEVHQTEIKGSIPELSLSNKNSAFLTGTQLDVNASSEVHQTKIKGSIPELSLSNKNSAFLTGTQLDVKISEVDQSDIEGSIQELSLPNTNSAFLSGTQLDVNTSEVHQTEIKGSIPELSLSNTSSAFISGTQLDVKTSEVPSKIFDESEEKLKEMHSHLMFLQLQDNKDENTSNVSERDITDVDDSTQSSLEIHFPNLLKSLGQDHNPKNFVEKNAKTSVSQESQDIAITLPKVSAMTSSLSEYESVKKTEIELDIPDVTIDATNFSRIESSEIENVNVNDIYIPKLNLDTDEKLQFSLNNNLSSERISDETNIDITSQEDNASFRVEEPELTTGFSLEPKTDDEKQKAMGALGFEMNTGMNILNSNIEDEEKTKTNSTFSIEAELPEVDIVRRLDFNADEDAAKFSSEGLNLQTDYEIDAKLESPKTILNIESNYDDDHKKSQKSVNAPNEEEIVFSVDRTFGNIRKVKSSVEEALGFDPNIEIQDEKRIQLTHIDIETIELDKSQGLYAECDLPEADIGLNNPGVLFPEVKVKESTVTSYLNQENQFEVDEKDLSPKHSPGFGVEFGFKGFKNQFERKESQENESTLYNENNEMLKFDERELSIQLPPNLDNSLPESDMSLGLSNFKDSNQDLALKIDPQSVEKVEEINIGLPDISYNIKPKVFQTTSDSDTDENEKTKQQNDNEALEMKIDQEVDKMRLKSKDEEDDEKSGKSKNKFGLGFGFKGFGKSSDSEEEGKEPTSLTPDPDKADSKKNRGKMSFGFKGFHKSSDTDDDNTEKVSEHPKESKSDEEKSKSKTKSGLSFGFKGRGSRNSDSEDNNENERVDTDQHVTKQPLKPKLSFGFKGKSKSYDMESTEVNSEIPQKEIEDEELRMKNKTNLNFGFKGFGKTEGKVEHRSDSEGGETEEKHSLDTKGDDTKQRSHKSGGFVFRRSSSRNTSDSEGVDLEDRVEMDTRGGDEKNKDHKSKGIRLGFKGFKNLKGKIQTEINRIRHDSSDDEVQDVQTGSEGKRKKNNKNKLEKEKFRAEDEPLNSSEERSLMSAAAAVKDNRRKRTEKRTSSSSSSSSSDDGDSQTETKKRKKGKKIRSKQVATGVSDVTINERPIDVEVTEKMTVSNRQIKVVLPQFTTSEEIHIDDNSIKRKAPIPPGKGAMPKIENEIVVKEVQKKTYYPPEGASEVVEYYEKTTYERKIPHLDLQDGTSTTSDSDGEKLSIRVDVNPMTSSTPKRPPTDSEELKRKTASLGDLSRLQSEPDSNHLILERAASLDLMRSDVAVGGESSTTLQPSRHTQLQDSSSTSVNDDEIIISGIRTEGNLGMRRAEQWGTLAEAMQYKQSSEDSLNEAVSPHVMQIETFHQSMNKNSLNNALSSHIMQIETSHQNVDKDSLNEAVSPRVMEFETVQKNIDINYSEAILPRVTQIEQVSHIEISGPTSISTDYSSTQWVTASDEDDVPPALPSTPAPKGGTTITLLDGDATIVATELANRSVRHSQHDNVVVVQSHQRKFSNENQVSNFSVKLRNLPSYDQEYVQTQSVLTSRSSNISSSSRSSLSSDSEAETLTIVREMRDRVTLSSEPSSIVYPGTEVVTMTSEPVSLSTRSRETVTLIGDVEDRMFDAQNAVSETVTVTVSPRMSLDYGSGSKPLVTPPPVPPKPYSKSLESPPMLVIPHADPPMVTVRENGAIVVTTENVSHYDNVSIENVHREKVLVEPVNIVTENTNLTFDENISNVTMNLIRGDPMAHLPQKSLTQITVEGGEYPYSEGALSRTLIISTPAPSSSISSGPESPVPVLQPLEQ